MFQRLTAPKVIKQEKQLSPLIINKHRFKALMGKNWKQFYRNISGWIFLLFFPVLEIMAFYYAVGPEIKNMPIAIVNDENTNNFCENFSMKGSAVPYGYVNCHLHNISCRFLKYLDHPMMNPISVDTLTEALSGIRQGKYVGAIHFSENYTTAAEERFNSGPDTSDDALNSSQIRTYLDMSNRQIGYTIKFKLLDLYMDFQKSLFGDCDYEKKFAEKPVHFFEPIYGEEGDHFTEFMTPGVLLTLAFFSGALLTSQIILTDKLEGVWDRSAVAGVSSVEILLTHFIIQFCILLVQNLEIFGLTFFYFGLTSVGSLWTIFLIIILQGVTGMAYGFWISVVSYNHSMANIVTTGTFYPMILLCGLLWPLEGQPKILRMVSNCLPFTIPSQSLRNVFMRGWGLNSFEVVNGIVIELAWVLGFVALCVCRLRNVQ
ncbi:hypothetical protein HHI36_009090 [Cryptolaemus montrouzieri]|uniref:ABC transmembrane type-2 domain-containing protein n=1 Tax=Cryptolaemus montrouzieri TaxID=559131 RepID=A0ABD2MV43_9CUCU